VKKFVLFYVNNKIEAMKH